MEMKKCSKCGEEKPRDASHFHKDKSAKDGLVNECKECVAERGRVWRKNNPEKLKENSQKWNERNPGKSTARAKKWREENPERYKANLKKWHQENKSHANQRNRDWYQKNKDRNRENGDRWVKNNPEKAKAMYKRNAAKYKERHPEKAKEWQKNNPELLRAYCQQYRARKKRLPATLTLNQWRACKEVFNHSCAYCGKPSKRLQQEHFIAVTIGGNYTINNIIPACKSCNSSKQDRDFFDWYPKQPFYSKRREAKILKYLNYDKEGKQQASIFEVI